jgi:hypothetical protein
MLNLFFHNNRSYLKISIFRSRSPAKDRRDKNARPRINPPRLTGSSTRILKYVVDLRRGLNTDIERKDFFEMASSHGEISHY